MQIRNKLLQKGMTYRQIRLYTLSFFGIRKSRSLATVCFRDFEESHLDLSTRLREYFKSTKNVTDPRDTI